MGELPISVLLADDHQSLREGLRLLLAVDGDIVVVAEAESGEDAVRKAVEHQPRVVLMDVSLAGLDGIEATRRLHALEPGLPIIMLSAKPDLHVVRAALDAGALGYLVKRASGDELRRGVRAAATGTPFFSAEVMAAARERGRSRAAKNVEDPQHLLTGRELEILQLIAGGSSNREIGEVLGISPKTVDTHRMHVMAKLDLHDVAGLTRYALRKGLLG